MSVFSRMQSLLGNASALLRDPSGNFALSFAIAVVPLTIAVGSSIDYVQAMNAQRRMQTDLDAAIVMAVQEIETNDEEALKVALAKWIEAEAEIKGKYKLDTETLNISKTNYTITANLSANIDTNFLGIIGVDSIPVKVSSSAIGGSKKTSKNAFSMYMVLDRSGSMAEETNTTYSGTCYNRYGNAYNCTKKYTKIESLKMAVSDLLDQFATADPESKYVRTGAISYNISAQSPVSLDWGGSHVNSYVEALTATGGTNSGDAMKTAYKALANSSENSAHKNMNGQTSPAKYIVFMTDGDNNDPSYDTTTKKWCDKARTDGMTIYSVAFMAPEGGQKLLKYCAKTSAEYFEAENTAELVKAFQVIGQSASKALVRLTQ